MLSLVKFGNFLLNGTLVRETNDKHNCRETIDEQCEKKSFNIWFRPGVNCIITITRNKSKQILTKVVREKDVPYFI